MVSQGDRIKIYLLLTSTIDYSLETHIYLYSIEELLSFQFERTILDVILVYMLHWNKLELRNNKMTWIKKQKQLHQLRIFPSTMLHCGRLILLWSFIKITMVVSINK